ncbi:MAG: hypothetical protein ACYC7C_11940 [Coriobacteriia bacterium]
MDDFIDLSVILENARIFVDWALSWQKHFEGLMWIEYPLLMVAVTAIGVYTFFGRFGKRSARTRRRR